MNRVTLVGRLTKEVNAIETKKDLCVARFTLAIDRPGTDAGTDFISCVAFGKTAEFVATYFEKGMRVAVDGRIQTGSYDKDGTTVYTTDVVAERVEFADGKKEDESKGKKWKK